MPHTPGPSGFQSGQGGITDPEVVIDVSDKHSFIVLRPLQVGWSLLRIGTVLSIKPLFVADNDFLLAVALQEADEELHHPQSSFPERHHDEHLTRQRRWPWRGKGKDGQRELSPLGTRSWRVPCSSAPGQGSHPCHPPYTGPGSVLQAEYLSDAQLCPMDFHLMAPGGHS